MALDDPTPRWKWPPLDGAPGPPVLGSLLHQTSMPDFTITQRYENLFNFTRFHILQEILKAKYHIALNISIAYVLIQAKFWYQAHLLSAGGLQTSRSRLLVESVLGVVSSRFSREFGIKLSRFCLLPCSPHLKMVHFLTSFTNGIYFEIFNKLSMVDEITDEWLVPHRRQIVAIISLWIVSYP